MANLGFLFLIICVSNVFRNIEGSIINEGSNNVKEAMKIEASDIEIAPEEEAIHLKTRGAEADPVSGFLTSLLGMGGGNIGGLTAFGLPNIDPLDIAAPFDLGAKKFLLSLVGAATDVQLRGLSALKLADVKSTANANGADVLFELKLPELAVVGKYELKALTAFPIPLFGKGEFKFGIKDIHFKYTGVLKASPKPALNIVKCDVTLGPVEAKFGGLGGDGIEKLGNKLLEIVTSLGKSMFIGFEDMICKSMDSILEMFINNKLNGIDLPPQLTGPYSEMTSFLSSANKGK